MKVFDIFSKREKRRRGEVHDVYKHEDVPEELRNQVILIWEDVFGQPINELIGGLSYPPAYKFIHDILCREHGKRTLLEHHDYYFDGVCNYFLNIDDTEKTIDVIDVSFQYIDVYVRNNPYEFSDGRISPDEAIAELNCRFQERDLGYQYESGQIIRVDSDFIHSEAMQPALKMLSDPMYEGANDEFLNAHKHYRAGRYKECMNECLKAFESCIKAICTKRRWKYKETDTINRLIEIVFDKELIPPFMQSHFTALKSTLASGVPTARNRQAGHGQGPTIITVPDYMAAYALHLTASNILFLTKANEAMK